MHYSHFKSAFSIENVVNEHFQMVLSWWGKGLWKIYMHHWTVHAKVAFQKCLPDVTFKGGPFHNFWSWTQKWKIYIDIFYGVSYNIKCITAISSLHFSKENVVNEHFQMVLKLMGKRFMENLHASLDSTCKSSISKMSARCHIQGGSIPQLLILNSEMKDLHWYLLWGFLQY